MLGAPGLLTGYPGGALVMPILPGPIGLTGLGAFAVGGPDFAPAADLPCKNSSEQTV